MYTLAVAAVRIHASAIIAEVKTEKEALALVDRIIAYYKENAQIERMGEFIDRIGLRAFKAAVLGDLEGGSS